MDLFNIILRPTDLWEYVLHRKLTGGSSLVEVGTSTDPYFFRPSPSFTGATYSKERDKVVGGSVGWNQLVEELNSTNWRAEAGSVTVSFADGVATVSAPANYGIQKVGAFQVLASHKYLLSYQVKGSAGQAERMMVASKIVADHTIASANTWETVTKITTPSAEGSGYVYLFGTGSAYTDLSFRNAQLIDLTQLFGSTIADHAYNLESQTSGKGVEFVSKLIDLTSYHAYSSGEIKSVEGLQSHDMTGFNQWDTSKDNTGKCLNGVGDLATNPNYAVSDYIRTVPNTVYYLKNVAPVIDAISYAEYDIDKVCVNPYGGVTGEHDANASGTITTGANTAYIRVVRRSTATDYCVNLHGERDGDYKPYVKHSYPLDSSLTLRGVPKLSNGAVYYDGDEYSSDGTVTRKYGVVDLGTLDYTYNNANMGAFVSSGIASLVACNEVVCAKYPKLETPTGGNVTNGDKLVAVNKQRSGTGYTGNVAVGSLIVKDTAYSDVATFKTAMNGVMLVYELATPTTEQATPYTNPQSVDPYGTEEYVTSGLVAVGHETTYLGKFESVGFGLGMGNPSAPNEDEPSEDEPSEDEPSEEAEEPSEEVEEVTEEITEDSEEPTEEADE